MAATLYWHDYETFGANPKLDRPVQFAGIRTDEELNIIGDPLVLYCKPSPDTLPQPEACLITGITPQHALAQGIAEADFIARIYHELSQPNTCGVGYNNIRFDDEVTRHTLYRNFYDAYAREWQGGNSRWDLIDVVRLTYALRPEGIEWPYRETGKPSFRLEDLTQANRIAHTSAHDALADVYATLAVARLLKQKQPKLYQYCYQRRAKQQVVNLLRLKHEPVLHISSLYAQQHCVGIVMPLLQHPSNANGIIVWNLTQDPSPWLTMSSEKLKQQLFSPDAECRPPVTTLYLNRCPIVVALNVLRAEDSKRLQIDLANCYQHLELLQACADLPQRLHAVFQQEFPKEQDPDHMLYDGDFFSDQDKEQMSRVRACQPEALKTTAFKFNDARLEEMLFRYRARNYPETLSAAETQQWQDFCRYQLCREEGKGLNLTQYFSQINSLRAQADLLPQKRAILDSLETYGKNLIQQLGLKAVV